MKRQLEDSSDVKNNRRRKLRLMIHAMDGCVPFLTPDILEMYFPPADDFWIGIAVRDTCVRPTYVETTKTKPKNPKREKKTESMKKTRDVKKPLGFTFEPVESDSWLEPYTKVVVPAFNWMQDDAKTKQKKDQMPTSGSTSSNQHVLVWTPHGRQRLTPEQHAKASAGLKPSFTLSLYDMIEEPANPRRAEKANSRNMKWFQELRHQRARNAVAVEDLWAPFLLENDGEVDIESLLKSYRKEEKEFSGVALIGEWGSGLITTLEKWLEDLPHVAVLATSSLAEILDIATTGVVDVIGTELPTLWSAKRLAFAVDSSILVAQGVKRQKADNDSIVGASTPLDENGCIDLSDKVFCRDTRPLVLGCTCLACKNEKFSRAYIQHLICSKELLADVLLFGHNLHAFLQLIRNFNTTEDPKALAECIAQTVKDTQTKLAV